MNVNCVKNINVVDDFFDSGKRKPILDMLTNN